MEFFGINSIKYQVITTYTFFFVMFIYFLIEILTVHSFMSKGLYVGFLIRMPKDFLKKISGPMAFFDSQFPIY